MGHNFKELLNETHKLASSAQVVGCTCAGIIGNDGPNESLRGLGIMAVKGPKEEFAISGSAFDATIDSSETASKLALDLKCQDAEGLIGRINNQCMAIKSCLDRISDLNNWASKPYVDGVEMLDTGS